MPEIAPDALLTRKAAATALTDAGFPISRASLATMASRGGGPPYRKFGTHPLYRRGDLLAWAESRLSAPRHHTAEGDAIDKAAQAGRAPRGRKARSTSSESREQPTAP